MSDRQHATRDGTERTAAARRGLRRRWSAHGWRWPSRPCRSTGCSARSPAIGGTPRRAPAAAAEQSLERTVTVRFDANVAPALRWRFEPEQRRDRGRVGETRRVFYKITNTGRPRRDRHRRFNVHAGDGRAPISTRSSASASPSRRCSRARALDCRSCSSSIPRSPRTRPRRGQHDHAVLHLLSRRRPAKAASRR